MDSERDGSDFVRTRLRNHPGREVNKEIDKFRWRYTTLQRDYETLSQFYQLAIPKATERKQQLQEQGYVFEIERRLHNYLSGLYTLIQQQETLQEGVGESYKGDLKTIETQYRKKESSRTVLGLRHYVQHENVLPLQVKTSDLNKTRSLIILLRDLHRQEKDDFESHFGHIDGKYLNPIDWIERDWNNIQEFFQDTIEVVEKNSREEMRDLNNLNEGVDALYEQLWEEFRDMERT